MRIVFFGTPLFAAEVLKFLIQNNVNIVAVISKPDKPKGRSQKLEPVPVKLIAQEYSLPIYQPEKVSAEEFYPTLQAIEADLFVVVAYGEILKEQVLKLPKKGCINLHASLLPKYRGAAPIQQAIIDGEVESGITIMYMVKKMDAGDMILQLKTPIPEEMTYGDLEKELLKLGCEGLLKVIQDFEKGSVTALAQDETKVTLAPKIELEQCQVMWGKSAQAIHNLIRGVNPEPGAWCMIKIVDQIKRLKLYTSKVIKNVSLKPGEAVFEKSRGLIVGCHEDALQLMEVQLEGKKRMDAKDFFRGLPVGHWEFLT